MPDCFPQTFSARLDWQDGAPVSRQFGDIYFARGQGLEETRHVFLQHNRLPERFSALGAGEFFTIAETGFGTGLNFLCAWQAWQQHAPEGAHLHFVSLEKYPLTPHDLARALALWPSLSPWVNALLAQYRLLSRGWHRFSFAHGKICLTLVVGDVAEVLPEIVAPVDAWFLDGFAPAKNPAMWTPQVLQTIAALSKPGATFATFTCVGEVRRNLAAAGFSVSKVPGFGEKRHNLCGIKTKTWGQTPLLSLTSRHAVVVGAGIAGASMAHALALRGWQVTVLDQQAQPAGAASGNSAGVLYPRFSHKMTPLAQFITQGFQHSVRCLDALPITETGWQNCGLLQLAFDAEEAQRIEKILQREDVAALGHAVDQAQATRFVGVEMRSGGLWLPHSGWVRPAAWCRALLQHPQITFRGDHEVTRLEKYGQGWEVHGTEDRVVHADVVVMCTAHQIHAFPQLAHLPVQPLRGQVTQLPATAVARDLKAVVCGRGYVVPCVDDTQVFGASFARDRVDSELSLTEQRDNLRLLQQIAPTLFDALLTQSAQENLPVSGRAALRAISPDFLPMLGAVPGAENLYVSLAHGARGLISAPLSAEIVASHITGEPMPVAASVMQALKMSRFRAASRHKIQP